MRVVAIIFVGVLFYSCSQDSLSPSEFMRWVEDPNNGLNKSKTIGAFELQIQYKPLEYIAVQEGRSELISESEVQTRIDELEGLDYYTLRIGSLEGTEMIQSGAVSEQEYQSRSFYFDALAFQDMKLVAGGDTLACVLYHFERNYGLAPYNNMVLAFEKPMHRDSDRQFIFEDQVLGLGPVKFTIAYQDISSVPPLKLRKNDA